MKQLKRFWVTSNGKARGGWIVASVLVDENGVESVGPSQTGFTTKKEAKRIARNLNQELANSAASASEPDEDYETEDVC